MNNNELYLKTAFCCMACDGEIANEELQLVKQFAQTSNLFNGIDIETTLNAFVEEINNIGKAFLNSFIRKVSEANLNETQELELAKIAIKMIAADEKIEYSEISFFKRIRNKLHVKDEQLTEIFNNENLFDKFPEVQADDFLLPDIEEIDDVAWNATFESISLNFSDLNNTIKT